jgi:hypothetical protein
MNYVREKAINQHYRGFFVVASVLRSDVGKPVNADPYKGNSENLRYTGP